MFKKILIANRGEIAARIINTCKYIGIKTAAIHSDADINAVHVINANEAVYIGNSEPLESYLNIDKIIDAAKKTNSDAIHPGYGFLSENSEFAKRCEDEGIIFIGPSSDVIKNLGDKIIARQIMAKSNIPIIPGTVKAETNPDIIIKEAEKIGYPIFIKAAAGGGGKGIRLVNSSSEIVDACAQAASEALSAFGDDRIYIEKFFNKAKHIEFQIIGDNFGNIIHLFERECSIQRRHQKIIEETPSYALNSELRKKMGDAAVAAAKASGYTNAGTVEFLLDENNNFYFLEINARIQVEHPITEMTIGIDIVKKQIEIAAGKKLLIPQEDIFQKGHAIECRIYAEDPENDFFPCPGKIDYIKEPSGAGVRCDSGVYSGFEVPVNYDPILSKLIVYAENRKTAISKMSSALKEYVILGIKTPIAFLIDIINSKEFKKGDIYTDFIEKKFSNWKPATKDKDAELACVAYIVDELVKSEKFEIKPKIKKDIKTNLYTPWQSLGNWKL
jgi:acetyl-CoA carboxylase, biotin carboxylase subunit